MVKLRLKRAGRKKLPFYHIVAADSRAPRDGKFLEVIGHYQPTAKPHNVTLDKERAAYWLGVGAQPTTTVRCLIRSTGLLHELTLKRKGRSEEEITAEMENWEQREAERLQKRLDIKARRRQAKKAAEAAAQAAEASAQAEEASAQDGSGEGE
ncbi:30S ribosomal protein S16 [Prosthecochloris sp. GSB1]|uniref:30S ribosomal protein S16 n=1 Tax=Prosthecochloris sp. GSB1 TaxID=281093 RepID=UPI000B8CAC60|nr:30S ribosomal protein S16 [Prosthecochloris sp. GSB1]ASQ90584.1 30S ribosomal protein S16 [Prosthecochloris sp. GSB1]